MVIVSLAGGLGNQLFQFAAGYSLARSRGQTLILDPSYERFTKAHAPGASGLLRYRLDQVLTAGDWYTVRSVSMSRTFRLGMKCWSAFARKSSEYAVIKESDYIDQEVPPHFCFWSFPEAENYWINGYWQNRSYFQTYETEILNYIISGAKSNSFPTIAIHIRKGDIVGTSMDICTPDYYRTGLEEIIRMKSYKKNKVLLKIFSQDIAWVQANVNLAGYNVHYVKGSAETTVQDFKSMIVCDDIVISNSTYSYWAALKLSHSSESVVVCPKWWWVNVDTQKISLNPGTWTILG
jgi:hypothetical protein